jgi:predicted O-methyltransferase YrrM
MGIISELSAALFNGDSPYKYARHEFIDQGYPHTFIDPALVSAILGVTDCKFWLEIGSMIGGSAIVTAEVIKEKGMDTNVVCIDPFTGDAYMWKANAEILRNGGWSFLQIKKCMPSIYERFIANVNHFGASDIVLPIPCTSMVGLRLIKDLHNENRISSTPEVIYLDSAHEVDETFMEVIRSWDLLKSGGILFGDDWMWDSVRQDVTRAFADSPISNNNLYDMITCVMPPTKKVGPILLYDYTRAGVSNTHWLVCK